MLSSIRKDDHYKNTVIYQQRFSTDFIAVGTYRRNSSTSAIYLRFSEKYSKDFEGIVAKKITELTVGNCQLYICYRCVFATEWYRQKRVQVNDGINDDSYISSLFIKLPMQASFVSRQ